MLLLAVVDMQSSVAGQVLTQFTISDHDTEQTYTEEALEELHISRTHSQHLFQKERCHLNVS